MSLTSRLRTIHTLESCNFQSREIMITGMQIIMLRKKFLIVCISILLSYQDSNHSSYSAVQVLTDTYLFCRSAGQLTASLLWFLDLGSMERAKHREDTTVWNANGLGVGEALAGWDG
jgi:hypothetical protein